MLRRVRHPLTYRVQGSAQTPLCRCGVVCTPLLSLCRVVRGHWSGVGRRWVLYTRGYLGAGTMPIRNLFKNCSYYWVRVSKLCFFNGEHPSIRCPSSRAKEARAAAEKPRSHAPWRRSLPPLFTPVPIPFPIHQPQGAAASISYFLNHPLYTSPPEQRVVAGFAAAMLCQALNLYSHVLLSKLRADGASWCLRRGSGSFSRRPVLMEIRPDRATSAQRTSPPPRLWRVSLAPQHFLPTHPTLVPKQGPRGTRSPEASGSTRRG